MAFQTAQNIFSKTKQALEAEEQMTCIFGPVHQVNIQYPYIHLLKSGETIADMGPVKDAANRYDPTNPLIPDKAVIARAGRTNPIENSMISYYECTRSMDNALPDLSSTLHESMAEVVSYPGKTTLRTVVFRPADGSGLRIRVQAVIEIYEANGYSAIRRKTYNMTTDDFAQDQRRLDNPQTRPNWCTDLDDVLLGHTDRGYRHVALALQQVDIDRHLDGSAKQFGLRRGPKYEEVLEFITTKVDVDQLPDDDRSCMYCTESFFEPGHEAMNPPCNVSRHIICAECMLKICEAKGVEDACCPECRSKFFITRKQLDFLKFGITEAGFVSDSRYTSWENFQRSCADLDKQSAINEETEIALNNPEALFNIWLSLISDDLSDSNEPNHRRFDFSPEYRTLLLVVENFFREFEGTHCTPRSLYEGILRDIRNQFMINWCEGNGKDVNGMNPGNRSDEGWIDDDMLFRPGMLEAIERSIERLVRALELRMCSCDQAGDDFGKHYHGDRYFWKAADVNSVQKSQQTRKHRRGNMDVARALDELEEEHSAMIESQQNSLSTEMQSLQHLFQSLRL
jgi:hypothetical protein